MKTLQSSGGVLGDTTGTTPVPITVSAEWYYFAVYPRPEKRGQPVDPVFLVEKNTKWLKHADKRSFEDSLKFLRKNLGRK